MTCQRIRRYKALQRRRFEGIGPKSSFKLENKLNMMSIDYIIGITIDFIFFFEFNRLFIKLKSLKI